MLPDFLRRQRWFAAKGLAFDRVAIDWQAIVAGEPNGLWLQVSVPDAADQHYSLPLALCWDDERGNENDAQGIKIGAADIVARVRQQERSGILYDAFAAPSFCHHLLAVMSGQQRLSATDGRISGSSTSRLTPALALPLPVKQITAASSNTTLALGDRLLLKAYRRLRPGINVEQEIGRFLDDVSPYRHCAPLAGAIDYADEAGTVTPLALALALAQQYVANQGDAWSRTLAYLSHFIAESERSDAAPDRSHCAQLRLLTRIGQRTGELHRALAAPADPATGARREDRLKDWETRARQAFLAGYRTALPPSGGEDRRAADNLLTFLLLEKTLYELRDELDNRPQWLAVPLAVPLAGLLELLGAAPWRGASEVASRANSV